jgi:hypothetical protein
MKPMVICSLNRAEIILMFRMKFSILFKKKNSQV